MQPYPSSALKLKPQAIEKAIEIVAEIISNAIGKEEVWDQVLEVSEELTIDIWEKNEDEGEELQLWFEDFLVTQALLTYQGGDPHGNQGP